MKNLGGIGQISGVVLDPVGSDIIIIGKTHPQLSPLSLDDLVNTLRCAHIGGLTGPGVSLEPSSENNVESGRLEVLFFGGAEGNVMGRVSFSADYLMKKIAINKVSSGVENLQSYSDLTRKWIQQISSGRSIENWNVLSRFWFAPIYAPIITTDTNDLFLLKELRVGVLAKILRSEVNGKMNAQLEDEAAQGYANQFTQRYSEVAKVHQEFADLARFMEALKVMTYLLRVGDSAVLSYWLSEYSPEIDGDIPVEVDILQDAFVQDQMKIVLVGGVKMACLTMLIRGGGMAALRDAILLARPSDECVAWIVSFDQDWRIQSMSSASEEDLDLGRRFGEGLIEHERGNDEGAVGIFQDILSSNSALVEAQYMRAICARDLAVKSGKMESLGESLGSLQELEREYPNLIEIKYDIGVTLLSHGHIDEAIDVLERVVGLRKDFFAAHQALGRAYLRQGAKAHAAEHLRVFLSSSGSETQKWAEEANRLLEEIDQNVSSGGENAFETYKGTPHPFQCSYPKGWTVLTGDDARELLPGMKETKAIVAAFVNASDPDQNVNIQIVPISAESLTDQDVEGAIPALDEAYAARFAGFEKVGAGAVECSGIKGVQYTFKSDRAGVRMQQCVVTLVHAQQAYTITFTSSEAKYATAWNLFFDSILSSFAIGR